MNNMNLDLYIGLGAVLSMLAGIWAGDIMNAHIRVKGGAKALCTALAVVVASLALILAGAAFNLPVAVCAGIFAFACEYSWAQNRQLDRICGDGQYEEKAPNAQS